MRQQKVIWAAETNDKKTIEVLVTKLNGLLSHPGNAKKAAVILEEWLKQKPKKAK
jgi:hypothetical protein